MASSAAAAAATDPNDDGLLPVSASSDPFAGAPDSKSHELIRDDGADDEDDDDEEEYEVEEEIEEVIEEEIEEEIEVETEEEIVEEIEEEEDEEEEEEEEEEDDDDENDGNGEKEEEVGNLGDDSSDSLVSPADDQNDLSQDKQSKSHEQQQIVKRDQLCVNDKDREISEFVMGELTGMAEGNRSQECGKENRYQVSATEEEDAGAFQEKSISKSHSEEHCHMNIDHPETEAMTDCTSKHFSVTERETTPAMLMSDSLCKESNGALQFEEEMKQMDMQFEEELTQRASRTVAPQRRPRSLSPGVKDENKRPAAVCDFFAKGWCIKGSSCRFLHRKDGLDNNSRHLEDDLTVPNEKREHEVDEGPRDIIERSRLAASPKLWTSSIGNNHISPSSFHLSSVTSVKHCDGDKISLEKGDASTFRISHEHGQSSLPKGDSSPISSFKDVGGENERESRANACGKHALSTVDDSLPMPKNGLLPGYGSLPGSTGISSNSFQSSGLSSSYTASLEEQATFRSQHRFNNHKSPVLGCSLNFGLNTIRLTSSISSKEYPHSYSPFSGSEPETLRRTKDSSDLPSSAGWKAKVSSNDWEPSVCFRPSFFALPSGISSPKSQYDPLRDSIAQSRVGDNIFPSGHEASILSTPHSQINQDPVLMALPSSEQNAERSFYHGFSDSVLDKNLATYGKDMFTNRVGIRGSSIAEIESINAVPKKEMQLGSSGAKEVRKLDNIHAVQDPRHKSSGARHKELKVGDAQSSDAYVDGKTDRDGQKESKSQRHFRASLVDFVKELVKPTWREGHLSKDAHKMIVKKVVDKVLTTLQPDQLPSTMDAVKQYLSLSRPKMSKLVEGYVEKYGKP